MRSFLPRPIGERGRLGAIFSPSPHRGEGTARCDLFSLAPFGRGDGLVRSFLPRPFGERGRLGAIFSPSPHWGEGTARCDLFSLAPLGRGDGSVRSFLPRPFGERAGVRGNDYLALTFPATSSAVSSISVPEITSGEVSPRWSIAIPPTAAPQVFAS